MTQMVRLLSPRLPQYSPVPPPLKKFYLLNTPLYANRALILSALRRRDLACQPAFASDRKSCSLCHEQLTVFRRATGIEVPSIAEKPTRPAPYVR
jgi:hypothetical protein